MPLPMVITDDPQGHMKPIHRAWVLWSECA